MDYLRFNPESSGSEPADDSKSSVINESASGMAKKRRNILSEINVKRDCSVKFDLDSTIESEADATIAMESSALKVLREVNKNRGLISINIDDTVASLEKTEVSEVVPANIMREKGRTRQISLDLEFSQSSIESLNKTGNHESIGNLTHATFSRTCERSHQTSLINQSAASDISSIHSLACVASSQMDGTYVVQNKSDDKTGKLLNITHTISDNRINSNTDENVENIVTNSHEGSEFKIGDTKQEVMPKDTIQNKETESTPLRRSLRNQKSDHGINSEKCISKRNDNLLDIDSRDQVEDISSNENTSKAIVEEKISAPLRKSLRKSLLNQDMNKRSLTNKSSQEKNVTLKIAEDQGEDLPVTQGLPAENNSVRSQSSKRKSLCDEAMNDSISRKKPSFNLESLDYDEDMEELQTNHTYNVSSNVDSLPKTPRIAQHSLNHLKENKRPLQPLVVNASLPKIVITEAQEKRNTLVNDSKSFENTVKEFTPEVCSTYIDIDCSDNLRSCIGNNGSSRFSKVDFERPPNCSELAQNRSAQLVINEIELPLSPEIRNGSPTMDLDLSTQSDDLDFDNDQPDASKHEQDLASANTLPTKPVDQDEELKSIEDSKNDNKEPDMSKHEQDLDSANALPTKPVDQEELESIENSKNDNKEPDALEHQQDLDSGNGLPTKPVDQDEELKSIENSKNDNKEPDALEHQQDLDSGNGLPTKPVDQDEELKSIDDSKNDNKEPDMSKHEQDLDSANALATKPVDHDEELQSNEKDPAVEPKSANSSKILPQAEILDEEKVSQESSSTEKRKLSDETKKFSKPSVTLKKRKTVKTSDSRDETVILNKSSLLRRTRSSSSTIKNDSKGIKSINDLSLDSSLDVSSIKLIDRKKFIYHSTPVHRMSRKAKMDEASEGEASLDISKLSEIPSAENNSSNRAVSRESSNKEESSKRVTRSSTSKLRSFKESSAKVSKFSSVKESIHKSRSNNSSQRDVSVGGNSEVDFDLGGTSGAKSQRSAREGNSLRGRFVESTTNINDSSTTFDTFDYSYDSDSSVVESTEPDPIAIWCEKLKKKPLKTKPKPPKLFMPPKCKWVNKVLYQYLENKLKPKFSIEATKYAEAFVMDLYDLYNRVSHGHPIELTALKNKAKEQEICTIELEFCLFLHRFMPFDFIVKVLPTGGACNSKVPPSSASPFDEL